MQKCIEKMKKTNQWKINVVCPIFPGNALRVASSAVASYWLNVGGELVDVHLVPVTISRNFILIVCPILCCFRWAFTLAGEGIWCSEIFCAPNAFLQAKKNWILMLVARGQVWSHWNGDTAYAVLMFCLREAWPTLMRCTSEMCGGGPYTLEGVVSHPFT